MQKCRWCFNQTPLFEASKLKRSDHAERANGADPGGLLVRRKSNFGIQDMMTEHSLWRFSRAVHSAINERQLGDLEALIDEDVDWAIYGPIDMFPFFGARRGKEAVLEVIRQIADNVRVRRFERESIMLGVDSASSMMRYSLTWLDSDDPVSLRIAHFSRFRSGRLYSLRVLIDSFDLVEQALGRPIHLPKIATNG
jgi:ketosteroid isomerase-like protein